MMRFAQYIGLLFLLMYPASQSIQAQATFVDWSEGGSRIAITTREGVSIYDQFLNLIAAQDFSTLFYFDTPHVSLSPDGTRIYMGNKENQKIFDTTTLQAIVDLQNANVSAHSAQWNSSGTEIAFRRVDGLGTMIYDATNGDLKRSFSTGLWQIGFLNLQGYPLWSPNDAYFAGVVGENGIAIFDALTGQQILQHQISVDSIVDLKWSPDKINPRIALVTSTYVGVGSDNSFPLAGTDQIAVRNEIIIIDAISGTTIISTNSIRDTVVRLEWSPSGTELAGWDGFRRLYIWDAHTGSLTDSFLTAAYRLTMQYSPYGGRLMLAYYFSFPMQLRTDDSFIPLSDYAQTHLNGTVQFYAPSASVEKLSTILASCAANSETVTSGLALLTNQQYLEFVDWVNQQASSSIPEICAADLRIIALTILDEGGLDGTAKN